MQNAPPPLLFANKEEIEARENYYPTLEVDENSLDRIVGGFRFAEDSAMRCGLNHCNTRHWKGYVIATKDGRETHCGANCGRRVLGVSFDDLEARFVQGLKRSQQIETLIALQKSADERLEPAEALLAALKKVYTPIQAIRAAFRKDARVDRAVEHLMRDGGAVRIAVELTQDEKDLRGNARGGRTFRPLELCAAYPHYATTLAQRTKWTEK